MTVLILDSGVGGLSILRAVRASLTGQRIAQIGVRMVFRTEAYNDEAHRLAGNACSLFEEP